VSDPRAFLAFDLGTATSSVALIARVGHRWRLIGGLSMPAGVELDAIVRATGGRLYPAKDGRMPPELFREGFPRWREFTQFIDPRCGRREIQP